VKRLLIVAACVLVCVCGTLTAARRQDAPKSVHDAAAMGDVDQINQFIEKGVDLNALDTFGYTPLKRAIDASQVEAVKALLQGGANPNTKDGEGTTPLIRAAITGEKDIIDALLAAKADTALKSRSGATAMHWGVQNARIDIVESLIAAGADVNATNTGGQTPLSIAQQRGNMPEIVDLLKQHGATVPVHNDRLDPYGNPIALDQTAQVTGPQSQLPIDFVIDPNVILADLAKVPALAAPLKVIDANSASEQRAWILRRTDNRTLLIRAVQKQFEDEMAFLKRVATDEQAAKTTKAVADLVAARKLRYQQIGTELREQRRQALQEDRDTTGAARGRTGRGGRTRSTTPGAQDNYGATNSQARPVRPARPNEQAEQALSPDTQSQVQAWLSTTAENKADLLTATHTLDIVEYAALHKLAGEENAAKTQTAIMGLLMLREQRIAKIVQKWQEDDERAQRLQEREGANNMQQGTQQGTQQQGTRRGRR
jgi:ankyrin repeat protein